VASKSSTGVVTLAEAQKLEKPSKAWDAVPAWVGQARFLRTLTYESSKLTQAPCGSGRRTYRFKLWGDSLAIYIPLKDKDVVKLMKLHELY
jgi:hypothetical protein